MRVNHRCAHILVAQQFLHGADVISRFPTVAWQRNAGMCGKWLVFDPEGGLRYSLPFAPNFRPDGDGGIGRVRGSIESVRMEIHTAMSTHDVALRYFRSSASGNCTALPANPSLR